MNLLFALQYLVLMVLTPPLTPEIERAHFECIALAEMITVKGTVEKLLLPFSTMRCISMSSSSSKLTLVIFSAASQDNPGAV